jgi:hypothetical protein
MREFPAQGLFWGVPKQQASCPLFFCFTPRQWVWQCNTRVPGRGAPVIPLLLPCAHLAFVCGTVCCILLYLAHVAPRTCTHTCVLAAFFLRCVCCAEGSCIRTLCAEHACVCCGEALPPHDSCAFSYRCVQFAIVSLFCVFAKTSWCCICT